MRRLIAFGVLFALCAVAPDARAQTYPTRAIRLVVPFGAGGGTDNLARIIEPLVSKALGASIVIENRPGGGSTIGMDQVAKAAPDGYTLVMATGGDVAINPAMFKEMPYDVERDFAPITAVSDAPLVLAVHGASPYKSVADVIAAAKAQPGRLSVATPGNGSINQIVLEWMALNTDTKFQHIPYKGGAPASAALAGGDVPLGILASSSVAPHVKSGRIRVLAVTMAKRSKLDPDWPTLQEQGVKDVDASNWTALFAPKATPAPVVGKLNAEVVKILAMPDVKERFAGGGVDTIPSTSAELDARVKQDLARFRTIVQKANIRPD
jgi:tripartite-type tricarboxylate transporter receptor subunit TctC